MTTAPGFTYAGPRSSKVACAVCGATGYDRAPWQEPHRRGHVPCGRCGKQLSVLLDGSARAHSRCPMRGDGAA